MIIYVYDTPSTKNNMTDKEIESSTIDLGSIFGKKTKKYECLNCGMVTKFESNYMRHVKQNSCKYDNYLKEGIIYQGKNEKFKCERCLQDYAKLSAIRNHIKNDKCEKIKTAPRIKLTGDAAKKNNNYR